MEKMETVKCLIIGGGPAGYTAAIYASRADIAPVVYEGTQPGGQLTTTTDIENYPGFENGISGQALVDDMRAQAKRLGADIRNGAVTSADLSQRPFKIVIDGEKEISAETLIIATGAVAKYLGLPSEMKYRGLGVSACATCDGFFYRKKVVAVVGGGDTACEEATYLAGLCRKVYLIVRRDVLRASEAMQERVRNTGNIEILWNCNTQEVLGDDYGVTGARIERKDGLAAHHRIAQIMYLMNVYSIFQGSVKVFFMSLHLIALKNAFWQGVFQKFFLIFFTAALNCSTTVVLLMPNRLPISRKDNPSTALSQSIKYCFSVRCSIAAYKRSLSAFCRSSFAISTLSSAISKPLSIEASKD